MYILKINISTITGNREPFKPAFDDKIIRNQRITEQHQHGDNSRHPVQLDAVFETHHKKQGEKSQNIEKERTLKQGNRFIPAQFPEKPGHPTAARLQLTIRPDRGIHISTEMAWRVQSNDI